MMKMKENTKKLLSFLGSAVMLAAFCCPVASLAASDNIRMIVPYAPGSGTDITARLLAEKLVLGPPVLVDNRPGAFSTLGTAMAARAAPDGDTMLLVGSTAITSGPFLMSSVSYDPLRDLIPVYQTATSPLTLYVSTRSPYQTVEQFIEDARRQPGRLNYSAHNANNMLAMELFKQSFGLHVEYIPYNSGPQALTDLVSGVVDVMFNDIAGSESLVAAGHIRPLAIMSKQRSSRLPDTPTLQEAGYDGYVVEPWNGIFFPAGTPDEVVRRLATEVNAILRDPQVLDRMETIGLIPPVDGSPEVFAEAIRAEIEVLRPLIDRLELRQ